MSLISDDDLLVKESDAPTSAQMIEQIRAGLASGDRAMFEKIITTVPEGFCLAPVLYSKIGRKQNNEVEAEFSSRVRPDFLHYLAHNYAEELGVLGICQHGIECMKKGLDPSDENGKLYYINVDHVIERAGGGDLSLQKAVDRLMPAGSTATFMVNHFSNLILLPEQVHNRKNRLNKLQKIVNIPPGQSKWVLMLVPEAGTGYVAPPQEPQHPLHGVHMRSEDTWRLIRHAEFMVDRAHDAIEAVCVAAPERSLSMIFNDASALTPEQQERLETFVKPAVEDMALRLKDAFDAAIKSSKPGDYRSFIQLYHGETLCTLRREMADLPVHEVLRQIDKALQRQFNQRAAVPVNDNSLPVPPQFNPGGAKCL